MYQYFLLEQNFKIQKLPCLLCIYMKVCCGFSSEKSLFLVFFRKKDAIDCFVHLCSI